MEFGTRYNIMKLCKDCKYFYVSNTNSTVELTPVCTKKEVIYKFDYVYGEHLKSFVPCVEHRANSIGGCGIDANWFEQKAL